MIGDRPPRWRVTKIVQHAWSRLRCRAFGHFYRPCYRQKGSKVQYECECCGELTLWMTKDQHHEFNRTITPTWGEPGSDSQGYKKMGKLRMPPKERTIGEPVGGWERGTYLVRVAFNKSNPIHNAVLHAPFINDHDDIRNEILWAPSWEREHRVRDVHYLEVVKRSDELSEFL